jgi:hypothetical protein
MAALLENTTPHNSHCNLNAVMALWLLLLPAEPRHQRKTARLRRRKKRGRRPTWACVVVVLVGCDEVKLQWWLRERRRCTRAHAHAHMCTPASLTMVWYAWPWPWSWSESGKPGTPPVLLSAPAWASRPDPTIPPCTIQWWTISSHCKRCSGACIRNQ